ncbi:tyrosine--tRNA ligase 1, cytoplasmic-like [Lolium rigidum]|uniref:tyrosine--tRNA ligase 1, cytoplasmic-like n=1 Tax=Lolium rigidum TaxID=89674 RepID=UPI001F5C20FF|nr:tyrosine--tRNA ligase 1, cytoplasmic-like [Lolium rigidum]
MADIAYSACCAGEVGASRVLNCAHTRLNPEASMFESNRADQSKISTVEGPPAANVGIHRDSVETSSDDRFAALSSIGGEYIGEDKLRLLMKKKIAPICYVWFEPCDMMDIEQGIMKTIYVNKIIQAGCTVKILMADWFLQQHGMIGNDLDKIRDIGNYNIEMWKATGMNLDRVELVWFSDELNRHAVNYWPLAVDVSRKYSMEKMASYSRNRTYGPQTIPAAEIFYPCMQVAAIVCQKADIWLFSMDQRDIVMLARDYAEDINRETKPAIILHNKLPLLPEDPDMNLLRYTARTLFMDDAEAASNRKIKMAFCPPKVTVCNEFLEYIKYVIFPWFGKLELVEKKGNGSNKTYASMEDFVVDYESGNLNSEDVKLAFRKGINNILKPVRVHFISNTEAQTLYFARKLQDKIAADTLKIMLQNREIDSPWYMVDESQERSKFG